MLASTRRWLDVHQLPPFDPLVDEPGLVTAVTVAAINPTKPRTIANEMATRGVVNRTATKLGGSECPSKCAGGLPVPRLQRMGVDVHRDGGVPVPEPSSHRHRVVAGGDQLRR
jgi:hypothetical protein